MRGFQLLSWQAKDARELSHQAERMLFLFFAQVLQGVAVNQFDDFLRPLTTLGRNFFLF